GGSFSGLLLHLGKQHRLLRGVNLEGSLGLSDLDGADRVRVALELAPVARELQERGDLLGRLCANAEPVERTLRIDLDHRGVLGGVVQTDLLDHATVALGARVGDDDAVEGCANLAETLETNFASHNPP